MSAVEGKDSQLSLSPACFRVTSADSELQPNGRTACELTRVSLGLLDMDISDTETSWPLTLLPGAITPVLTLHLGLACSVSEELSTDHRLRVREASQKAALPVLLKSEDCCDPSRPWEEPNFCTPLRGSLRVDEEGEPRRVDRRGWTLTKDSLGLVRPMEVRVLARFKAALAKSKRFCLDVRARSVLAPSTAVGSVRVVLGEPGGLVVVEL